MPRTEDCGCHICSAHYDARVRAIQVAVDQATRIHDLETALSELLALVETFDRAKLKDLHGKFNAFYTLLRSGHEAF
jgi:hypothetical protein